MQARLRSDRQRRSPKASIIVPTFNRYGSLLRALESVACQDYPQELVEVVIVDDGSTDDTHLVCERHFSYNLRYVWQANQGSAAARNTGACESTGDLLIFIDDDIILESGYVRTLVQEHQDHDNTIAMGVCYTHAPEPVTLFARYYGMPSSNEGMDAVGLVSLVACMTNNLSVERDDFFGLGMMQDVAGDGPTWWGDVDFAYRAYRAGYSFRRSEKAICHHFDYAVCDLKTACQRAEKASQMAEHLFGKYPDLRQHITMFHDKEPIDLTHDSPRLLADKIFHITTAWPPILAVIQLSQGLLERCMPKMFLLHPLYRWIVSAYVYRGYRRRLEGWHSVSDSHLDEKGQTSRPRTATK